MQQTLNSLTSTANNNEKKIKVSPKEQQTVKLLMPMTMNLRDFTRFFDNKHDCQVWHIEQ